MLKKTQSTHIQRCCLYIHCVDRRNHIVHLAECTLSRQLINEGDVAYLLLQRGKSGENCRRESKKSYAEFFDCHNCAIVGD